MRMIRKGFLAAVLVLAAGGPLAGAPLGAAPHPAIGAPESSADGGGSPGLEWLYVLPAVGAIRIKDTGSLAKKFVTRAGSSAAEYTSSVQASGQDWEANTKASEPNYVAGVQQAAADGRFGRGVAAAGAAKFVTRASTLGSQRYPTGIAAAEGDWARGTQPYLDALKSIELPPRRPKGDPSNMQRAQAVAAKLRAMKLGK